MASTDKAKVIDIAQTGSAGFRELQKANESDFSSLNPELQKLILDINGSGIQSSMYDPLAHITKDVASPFLDQKTHTGDTDYWGNSFFDSGSTNLEGFSRLSDTRAENQPWVSQLVNGIGKAGVLAVTTALETAGLLYGVGEGIGNAISEEGSAGDKASAFLHGVWNNPITRALKRINDYAEEYLPNYYTQDELENPFHNIFTANFLGDKLLKNFGFMVGAFYGGIPLSKAVGAIGRASVLASDAARAAEGMGMAKKIQDIYDIAAKTGEDAATLLAKAGLTDAEKSARILQGMDNVRKTAQLTRATSMAVGSLASAINEGAIEAINNSEDWYNTEKVKEDDRHAAAVNGINDQFAGTELYEQAMLEEDRKHNEMLAELEKGKASMGNADLLFNIPILMASNMFQLGKLYARGFNSTKMTSGGLWDWFSKMPGSIKNGTLKSLKTNKGAVISALLKSNTEGLEEYLQRSASDASGDAVSNAIKRYVLAGEGEDTKADIDNYIAGFGKAVADNLGNPNAWEEYMIGAVSSAVGMPVFGSQTRNAYGFMKDNGVFGFAGGFVGNYQDYMDKKKKEDAIAKYLNERVTSPDSKFKPLYDALKKNRDLDVLMRDPMILKDKAAYKELEFEKLFNDIDAAAASGHLAEFKEMIGYNEDYTDEELEDIIELTKQAPYTAEQQKKDDTERAKAIEEMIGQLGDSTEDVETKKELEKDLKAIQERLNRTYKDIEKGPYIVRDNNGNPVRMNTTEEGKQEMRDILNKNRENLLKFVDDYVKTRNDIDIETDGRLTDEQLTQLTQMKMKILNFDFRSADMAVDIIRNMQDFKSAFDKMISISDRELENKKKTLEDVKSAYDNAKGKNKKNLKTQVNIAQREYDKAQNRLKNLKSWGTYISRITDKRKASSGEIAAERRGYGEGYENAEGTMNITPEELMKLVADRSNVGNLLLLLRDSDLDDAVKVRLATELVDMNRLAEQRIEYRTKLNEFMENPEQLEKTNANIREEAAAKQNEVRVDDFVDRVANIGNLHELNDIITDMNRIDSDLATEVLSKVKKKSNNNAKGFIEAYEKGYRFFNAFRDKIAALENREVSASILNSIIEEWEFALNTDGSDSQEIPDLQKTLTEAFVDIAESFRKSTVPYGKEAAEAIDTALADLNEAGKVANTNSASTVNVSKKTQEKKTTTPANDGKKSRDTLLGKIREAMIQNGVFFDASGITKSPTLKAFWESYQEKKDLDGYEPITDDDILSIAQGLMDEDFDRAQESSGLENGEAESSTLAYDNTRSVEMSSAANSNFISDYVSEFSTRSTDIKVPYDPKADSNPNAEQINDLRQFLSDRKAYEFVNSNLLGYIHNKNHDMTDVFFLRSTDPRFRSDPDDSSSKKKDIVFVAIKIGEDERALLKNILGEGYEARMDLTTIDGVSYQIVGTLSFTNSADDVVKDAFTNMLERVVKDNDDNAEKVKKNSDFILCEKEDEKTKERSPFKSEIHSINTGRLDVANSEKDKIENNKIDLLEFIVQENDASRLGSLEWKNGNNQKRPFVFSVIVNKDIDTGELDKDKVVKPNQSYLEDEKRNGAVFMFIPKPDGKYYPIRITRKTVKEWIDDGNEEVLDDILATLRNSEDPSEKNQYIYSIVKKLMEMMSSNLSAANKYEAREALSGLLYFNKVFKFHIENNALVVKYNGTSRTYNFTNDAETLNNNIKELFNLFRDNGVMFTIPATYRKEANITSKDIIESGAFKVGIRGFYNFNANFTIVPIDGENNKIEVSAPPRVSDLTDNRLNMRTEEIEYTHNGVTSTYLIREGTDEVIGRVVGTEVKDVSDDEKAIIGFLRQVETNGKSFLEMMVEKEGMSENMADALMNELNEKKWKDKTYKTIKGNEVWYIVTSKNGKTVWFTQDDKEFKDLETEFQSKASPITVREVLKDTEKKRDLLSIGDDILNGLGYKRQDRHSNGHVRGGQDGWKVRFIVKNPKTGKAFTQEEVNADKEAYYNEAVKLLNYLKEYFSNPDGSDTISQQKPQDEYAAHYIFTDKEGNRREPFKFLTGGEAGEADFTIYIGSIEDVNKFISDVQSSSIYDLLAEGNDKATDIAFNDRIHGRIEGQSIGFSGYMLPDGLEKKVPEGTVLYEDGRVQIVVLGKEYFIKDKKSGGLYVPSRDKDENTAGGYVHNNMLKIRNAIAKNVYGSFLFEDASDTSSVEGEITEKDFNDTKGVEVPVTPDPTASQKPETSGKMFVGWDFTTPTSENENAIYKQLRTLSATNKKMANNVLQALQGAEEQGKALDLEDISATLDDINRDGDRKSKKDKIDNLVNRIKKC